MTEAQQTHALYLRDLGCLLKQMAIEARRAKEATADDNAYELGRLMALHEVIALMQEQAVAFGLGLGELCIDDIDPERDLL